VEQHGELVRHHDVVRVGFRSGGPGSDARVIAVFVPIREVRRARFPFIKLRIDTDPSCGASVGCSSGTEIVSSRNGAGGLDSTCKNGFFYFAGPSKNDGSAGRLAIDRGHVKCSVWNG
jgi:hypothetical protein